MEERLIKRYANRKMYDVKESRYVSLGELAEIVRSGATIRVTNKNEDEDYTAQILRQIILEQSRQADESSIPTLHEWVRMGGNFIDRQWDDIRKGMEGWIKNSTDRLLQGMKREDFAALKRKIELLEKKIEDFENKQVNNKK